jgi:predicted secreted Zn-dependent protease
LTEYDDLLQEVKTRAEAYRSTARVFIPKMYNALRDEDPNITSQDARDRIEKIASTSYGKSRQYWTHYPMKLKIQKSRKQDD